MEGSYGSLNGRYLWLAKSWSDMNLDSGACRVLELQQAVSFVLQLVHLRLVGQQVVGLENLMEVQAKLL